MANHFTARPHSRLSVLSEPVAFAGLWCLSALFLFSGVAGCSLALTKDLVRLPAVSKCPGWDVDRVMDNGSRFGPTTPVGDLECALSVLRDSLKTMDRAKVASRLCWLLADQTQDQEKHSRFAAEGVRWAQISLNLGNWFDGEVHYFLAVNLGMAVEHSTIKAIKNLHRIMEHLKKAIKQAPDTDMGGPERVLAMVYLRAPGWPTGIGDVDKAVDMLKELCKKYPDHPLNHIFYAEALWAADGDDDIDIIRTQLNQAVSLIKAREWGYYTKRWLKKVHQMRCKYGILKKVACGAKE